MRKQLHQSGLEMLSKCGTQFEFRYIKGIKRPPNAFLICGKATDRAVNTDLDHKIATGELEQESVLLDVARDAVEHDPDKNDIQLDEDEKGRSVQDVLSDTKDKAVRLVKAHHGDVAPIIEPFKTARKFSIDLDKFLRQRATQLHEYAENEVNRWTRKVSHQQAAALNAAAREGTDFVGEQDILEKLADGLVIRDTKTSRKSPNAEEANKSHQLSAYALASHVIDGQLPKAVKLDYLVDLKSGAKTVTLESSRDLEDIRQYLNRIANAVATIRSGNFAPAPNTAWWCDAKWCAYHSMCPYVRNRKTVVLTADLTGKLEESIEKVKLVQIV